MRDCGLVDFCTEDTYAVFEPVGHFDCRREALIMGEEEKCKYVGSDKGMSEGRG